MQPLFEYTDYRKFLQDHFSDQRRKNPSFSFRVFSRMAGMASSGFIKMVMDRQRNLSDESAKKVGKALGLSGEQQRFFTELVRFNQAQSHEEKDRHFRELCQHRKLKSLRVLTAAHYSLFSHWYYVALLELLRVPHPKQKSIDWIQDRLVPEVNLHDINQALKDLKALGLVEGNRQKGWEVRDTPLTTPNEVQSLALTNFHVQMSQLAAQAVTQTDSEQREFSSLSILVPKTALPLIKKEIQKLRRRLHLQLEDLEKTQDSCVIQINLQMFPLTRQKG